MHGLVTISSREDIPAEYRDTPIGEFLEYHNLEKEFELCPAAKLLIGMCMDNRKHMRMPDNFSYIIRTAGANLRFSEFTVSFAIAIGGIRHIALIGHTNCGMVGLHNRKEQFIRGMVESADWSQDQAENNFNQFAPLFEIGNEIDFITSETKRLRMRYPHITVAPMLYRVEDNRIYLISEE
jgi:carbonic anhydrase